MSIMAQYPGRCADGDYIEVGDLIERTDEGDTPWKHVECGRGFVRTAPDPLELKPNEVVCTSCFLVKPCECDA